MGKPKLLLICPIEQYRFIPYCFEQYIQNYYVTLPYDFLYITASEMLTSFPRSPMPKQVFPIDEKWFNQKVNFTISSIKQADACLIMGNNKNSQISLQSYLSLQEELKAVTHSGKEYSYWDETALEEPAQKLFIKK